MASDNLFPLRDHVKVELREQGDVRQHDGDQDVGEVERHVELIGHCPREDIFPRNPGQADVAAPQLPGHSDGIEGEKQGVPANNYNI